MKKEIYQCKTRRVSPNLIKTLFLNIIRMDMTNFKIMLMVRKVKALCKITIRKIKTFNKIIFKRVILFQMVFSKIKIMPIMLINTI